jgi:hypothetical protein
VKQLFADEEIDTHTRVQYLDRRPGSLPCPAGPLENQTITPNDKPLNPSARVNQQVLGWQSNIIPWYTGQPSPNGGVYANQSPISGNYYRKFGSIPAVLAFFAGMDFNEVSSASPDLTVFLKDFQDRGANNLAKTNYLFAVTTDKMPFYVDKIRSMINEVFTATVSGGLPVLSTFKQSLVKFFISIHTGQDAYPEFILRYFTMFIDVIGFIGQPKVSDQLRLWLLEGRRLQPLVRKYYAERTDRVLAEGDQSTFVFWWHQIGLAIPSLITESLHNIVAFTQFINTFYRIIVDKVWAGAVPPYDPNDPQSIPCWFPPTLIPFIPLEGDLEPLSIKPVDFFLRYDHQSDPAQKLNVIREVYRLLTPNSNAFSKVEGSGITDNIQGRHIWTQLMIAQQPILEPLQGRVPQELARVISYYTFRLNPALPALIPGFQAYPGFDTVAYPDEAYHPHPPPTDTNENLNSIDFVEFSPADNNPRYNDGTVLDRYNNRAQPVYNQEDSQASNAAEPLRASLPFPYYPFGTSYRRCPGEIFSYFLTGLLVDKFARIDFEFRPVAPCCDPESPKPDRYIAIAPLTAVFDNLYVKQPLYPL